MLDLCDFNNFIMTHYFCLANNFTVFKKKCVLKAILIAFQCELFYGFLNGMLLWFCGIFQIHKLMELNSIIEY